MDMSRMHNIWASILAILIGTRDLLENIINTESTKLMSTVAHLHCIFQHFRTKGTFMKLSCTILIPEWSFLAISFLIRIRDTCPCLHCIPICN